MIHNTLAPFSTQFDNCYVCLQHVKQPPTTHTVSTNYNVLLAQIKKHSTVQTSAKIENDPWIQQNLGLLQNDRLRMYNRPSGRITHTGWAKLNDANLYYAM